jgi:hypothetical protein
MAAVPVDLVPATIASLDARTLAYGEGGTLRCLYVVVEPRPDVDRFLAQHDDCGNLIRWACHVDPGAGRAQVGVDLLHGCGASDALRLAFDLAGDADALAGLGEAGVLVVATAPWPSDGPVVAYAIDPEVVAEVVATTASYLRQALARWN